jgi:hypothetical protein
VAAGHEHEEDLALQFLEHQREIVRRHQAHRARYGLEEEERLLIEMRTMARVVQHQRR